MSLTPAAGDDGTPYVPTLVRDGAIVAQGESLLWMDLDELWFMRD